MVESGVPSSMLGELMTHAVEASRRGIAAGQSPFGAAIGGRDGSLICAMHNTVRSATDCTAHAEINAIREACRRLKTIDLSGCVLASTCEPCPMCAAAIHWARIETVCFGAGIDDARRAGFHELAVPIEALYAQGGSGVRVVRGVMAEACVALFEAWREGPNPVAY